MFEKSRPLFNGLRRMHWILFIGYGLGLVVLVGYVVFSVAPAGSDTNSVANELSDIVATKFVVVVLLAPLLETFVFQSVPFFVFRWFTKGQLNFWLCLFVSASAFGLSHSYNVYYFLAGFLVGAVFIHLYYLANLRRQSAFALVFAVHALNNLVVFLAKDF